MPRPPKDEKEWKEIMKACEGCTYRGNTFTGHCCDYYYITGKHLPCDFGPGCTEKTKNRTKQAKKAQRQWVSGAHTIGLDSPRHLRRITRKTLMRDERED